MNRVFVDMDGVIVDFEEYKVGTGLTAEEIKQRPGAYLDMPAIIGAVEAVRSLIGMGFEVWIATKPPTGVAYAYSDKVRWILRELPELKRRIILTHDKGLLGDTGDYLCDDRPHKANCEQFKGKLLRFVDGYHWPQALEYFRSVAQSPIELHGLDNPDQVFFYEQDFYVLSNFSSFQVEIWGHLFPTSEHAYHFAKFPTEPGLQHTIMAARSGHDAFKFANEFKKYRRPDWDEVKEDVMGEVLMAKVRQHEYVRRKLLATGDRVLIENSWRDDVWGWGPNKDGQNLLGNLWMKIREALRVEVRIVTDEGSGEPA